MTWAPLPPAVLNSTRPMTRTKTICYNGVHTQLCHTPSFTHNFVTHLSLAGVAIGDIYLRLAWQAWHLATSTCGWRGKCGTWRHLPAFGVAGVALVALGGALGRRGSPLIAVGRRWSLGAPRHFLRGRRGTR